MENSSIEKAGMAPEACRLIQDLSLKDHDNVAQMENSRKRLGMMSEASRRLLKDLYRKDHNNGASSVGKDDASRGDCDGTKSVNDTASVGPLFEIFDGVERVKLTEKELHDFYESYIRHRDCDFQSDDAEISDTPVCTPYYDLRVVRLDSDDEAFEVISDDDMDEMISLGNIFDINSSDDIDDIDDMKLTDETKSLDVMNSSDNMKLSNDMEEGSYLLIQ